MSNLTFQRDLFFSLHQAFISFNKIVLGVGERDIIFIFSSSDALYLLHGAEFELDSSWLLFKDKLLRRLLLLILEIELVASIGYWLVFGHQR